MTPLTPREELMAWVTQTINTLTEMGKDDPKPKRSRKKKS